MSADHPYGACTGGHCVTCADEGVPMTVLGGRDEYGLAPCASPDGIDVVVDMSLVDDPARGDCVLVHAGVAIATLRATVDVSGA